MSERRGGADESRPTQTKKGDLVGEWALDELLGEGSFGQVWSARSQAEASRRAALKLPRDERGAALLAKEGAVQGKLKGPRFPKVLGVSKGDPAYIAFELVDGESLREVLRSRRLEPGEAGEVAREILSALAEAHESGVVHRDLKPENVLVARDGRVLVTDFGLALHGQKGEMAHSLAADEASEIAGSLPYLAPEVRERKPADERTDIYAWGVVLFELLTGNLPAAADLPSSTTGVPVAYDEIYRKACARRENRYAKARDALRDLERVLEKMTTRRLTPLGAKKTKSGKHPKAPKVDVHALLDRVGKEESDFLAREFIAYVTPDRRATARVKGKTYVFEVKKGLPGLAILKALSPTEAAIVKVLPALPD